jgi:uncharacterized protein YybS (DUF2232 family)
MLELFGLFKMLTVVEGYDLTNSPDAMPTSWIIMALIIAFGTAYLAFACNEYERPATRALSTIIAFFFSGFYLIYYFIVHVLFDRKCGSRGINNIVKGKK